MQRGNLLRLALHALDILWLLAKVSKWPKALPRKSQKRTNEIREGNHRHRGSSSVFCSFRIAERSKPFMLTAIFERRLQVIIATIAQATNQASVARTHLLSQSPSNSQASSNLRLQLNFSILRLEAQLPVIASRTQELKDAFTCFSEWSS